MTARDTGRTPMRHTIRIAKHHDGDTSHAPDEIFEKTIWEESDGTIVEDPARIAELEALVASKEIAHDGPANDSPDPGVGVD